MSDKTVVVTSQSLKDECERAYKIISEALNSTSPWLMECLMAVTLQMAAETYVRSGNFKTDFVEMARKIYQSVLNSKSN